MTIKPRENFSRQLFLTSEQGRSFYRFCRRQICRARKRRRSEARIWAHSRAEAMEALVLLTHPWNGFRAFEEQAPLYGDAGRPCIVVDLTRQISASESA